MVPAHADMRRRAAVGGRDKCFYSVKHSALLLVSFIMPPGAENADDMRHSAALTEANKGCFIITFTHAQGDQ